MIRLAPVSMTKTESLPDAAIYSLRESGLTTQPSGPFISTLEMVAITVAASRSTTVTDVAPWLLTYARLPSGERQTSRGPLPTGRFFTRFNDAPWTLYKETVPGSRFTTTNKGSRA